MEKVIQGKKKAL